MEKIYLSDAGPKVSPAIYGFYRWAGEDLSYSKMEGIINLCLELGINTFDHADIYGSYYCEELFGKLIQSKSIKREDIVLFTKAGLCIPHHARPEIRIKHQNNSADHLTKSLDTSLQQLKTDYVDVFLLNGWDALADIEETAIALQRIKDSGKAKSIGVVNFSVFQHQLLSSYLRTPIVTNHVELNLINTAAFDNGQIDYIKQRYIRPLATSPLAEGKIAESNEATPLRLRNKLNQIARQQEANFESVAVAWLIRLGALPLIGTTNEERIKNVAAAFNITLDRQDWYELYEIAKGVI
jgi:predicted oxidoreductase